MKNSYPFELIPLPYGYGDLEPYIDTKTMETHHDKHLKTYVDNLNKALEKFPAYHNYTLEELLYNLTSLPEEIQIPVKNNGGGVYNHNLFFATMGQNSTPSKGGALLNDINKRFGSLETFKAELKAAALGVFGSGWAYLVADKDKNLGIIKTANQETPIPNNLCPIIILDVWEHAYYLKYQNKRADYIDNWFNVINWEKAEENYNKCKHKDFSK